MVDEFIDIQAMSAELEEEEEIQLEAYEIQKYSFEMPMIDNYLLGIQQNMLHLLFNEVIPNNKIKVYALVGTRDGYTGMVTHDDLSYPIMIPERCKLIILKHQLYDNNYHTSYIQAKGSGNFICSSTNPWQSNTMRDSSPYMRLGTTQTQRIKFTGDETLYHQRYRNYFATDLTKKISQIEVHTSFDGPPQIFYNFCVDAHDVKNIDITMQDAAKCRSREELRVFFASLKIKLNNTHKDHIAYKSINEYFITEKDGLCAFLDCTGMKFCKKDQREMEEFRKWKQKNLEEIALLEKRLCNIG